MKVLILVQSVDKPEFIRIRKAQQQTWDSIEVPDVQTVYYLPGNVDDVLEGNTLRIFQDTHWTHMFFTLAKAIRHMLRYEWDYLFKTDNSTYVDKALLHKILLSKPREKYFGGMSFPWKIEGVHSMDFLWGDGYAMSRDMAEYIVQCYNKAPFKGLQEDDIIVSKLLLGKCEWDTSLHVYIPAAENFIIKPGHHVYRVRVEHLNYSPAARIYEDIDNIITQDIEMMHKIHNTLTNGKTDNREGVFEEAQDKA